MILVSPTPWKKIIRNWGQNVTLRIIWGQNNESAFGGKTMKLHSKTEDGTLKYENQQKNSRGREM